MLLVIVMFVYKTGSGKEVKQNLFTLCMEEKTASKICFLI